GRRWLPTPCSGGDQDRTPGPQAIPAPIAHIAPASRPPNQVLRSAVQTMRRHPHAARAPVTPLQPAPLPMSDRQAGWDRRETGPDERAPARSRWCRGARSGARATPPRPRCPAAASPAPWVLVRRAPSRHACRVRESRARRSGRFRRGAEPLRRIRCPATASDVVIEPERRVTLAVLDPVLTHFDEQKQMDAAIEHPLELGTCTGADRLDSLPSLAEHDRSLTRTLDKDHLLYPDTVVLSVVP